LNDPQENTTLVLKHSLHYKLIVSRVRYCHGGAEAALLRTWYLGKRGNYIRALYIEWRTLDHRPLSKDFHGYHGTAPPQYPADDVERIAVEVTPRLWKLDVASAKLLGDRIGHGNAQDFD
jgi:hypothetical protein